MSPSALKYYFGSSKITLNNNVVTTADIKRDYEPKRLTLITDYIIDSLIHKVPALDILSLEEIADDWPYLRQDIENYIAYTNKIYTPHGRGDWLTTYINSYNILLLENYTADYQRFYNDICGNVSPSNQSYPARAQIFYCTHNAATSKQKPFYYVHVHGPGIPIDNIKKNFYQCLSSYLQSINTSAEPVIIIGDFNDSRLDYLTAWLNHSPDPISIYQPYNDPLKRFTSYHKIIHLTAPFNYDYIKSDAMAVRYDNQYNKREVDELIYKKVDHLFLSSVKALNLETQPAEGLYKSSQLPYILDTYIEKNVFLDDLDSRYLAKKLLQTNFRAEFTSWISDHTYMSYTLEIL